MTGVQCRAGEVSQVLQSPCVGFLGAYHSFALISQARQDGQSQASRPRGAEALPQILTSFLEHPASLLLLGTRGQLLSTDISPLPSAVPNLRLFPVLSPVFLTDSRDASISISDGSSAWQRCLGAEVGDEPLGSAGSVRTPRSASASVPSQGDGVTREMCSETPLRAVSEVSCH